MRILLYGRNLKKLLEKRMGACTFVQTKIMGSGEINMNQSDKKVATSYYNLLNKQDLAGMLGCTVRTVDRMLASNAIPAVAVVRIPTGVKGNVKTRFLQGQIITWIKSLALTSQAEIN